MKTLALIPGWDAALSALADLLAVDGPTVRDQAKQYANTYQHRRAAMVFDVVASRQRRYQTRVLPMVMDFEKTPQARSLAALARKGPIGEFGLRRGEAETMQAVAAGLVQFAAGTNFSGDDEIALQWAVGAEPFVFASKLEPYVGSIDGIGSALFAYLRMRSGANAIKPDVRVRKALNSLGLCIPPDNNAITLTCLQLSTQLNISALELDQLLWHLDRE